MNKENFNQILRKEVELYIKRKIKDIITVDEIIATSGILNIPEVTTIVDLEKSYRNLHMSKSILQLTINVYNHFELYKDLTIKYDKEMKALESFYKHDEVVNVLRCYRQPDERDVTDALYNYVIWFKSTQRREHIVLASKEDKEKMIDVCPLCDNNIPRGRNKCEVCEESMESIIIYEHKKTDKQQRANVNNKRRDELSDEDNSGVIENDKNKDNPMRELSRIVNMAINGGGGDGHLRNEVNYDIEGESNDGQIGLGYGMIKEENWICKQCSFSNSCLSKNCHACEWFNLKTNDTNNVVTDKLIAEDCAPLNNIEEICHQNKVENEGRIETWKCGKCEKLNEFIFGNCEVCGTILRDGHWICRECTTQNHCDNSVCTTCKYTNQLLGRDGIVNDWGKGAGKGNVVEYNGDENWECGRCHLLEPYKVTICSVCGASRIENGMWSCVKCTFSNKCNINKCDMCQTINNSLSTMCDNSQHRTKEQSPAHTNKCAPTTLVESREWKCQNKSCPKIMNEGRKDYCHGCGLFRDHCRQRGAAVAHMKNKDVESVWICVGCNKFNTVTNVTCAGKNCREGRYKTPP